MSLNLLGLGFSFGAKDRGLKKEQRRASSGFENIGDEVEKMGKRAKVGTEPMGEGFNLIGEAVGKLDGILRVNRLQAFIQAISLSRLGDIAHGVEDIATNGLNLTTSFEGTIVAANKTAKQIGANFGLAGKDLSRFTDQATSMHLSLNIGADKAAEAAYNVTLATKELGAVGLKSASDLAKFAEVSGISAQDTTQIFKQAGQDFGFTGEQLRMLAGAALESGKQIGDIGGQFKQMPHILELISRRAAVLGEKFDSKKMASFASQTLAVSGALYNMGATAEEAREAATALADKMVESGENFGNMFAGTSSDLSDFHMALAVAGGDTKVAFDTMTQGPGEFMASLASMVSKGKKSGKDVGAMTNLMRGQLEKVFGPKQAARMIDFFNNADTAVLDSMSVVSKAQGDLGKFAKAGFSTGRTLADSFDLMKDQFITSFRGIGRSAAVDFVSTTGKEFKKFNSQMKDLVKEGGTLGLLVQKFSELHQIGALALVPHALRPLAAVFGSIVKEAGPMIGVLGSLGLRLNMLASPVTLILAAGAALLTWFAALRMEGKSTGEAIKIMGTKIAGVAKKVWETAKLWTGELLDYLAGVDWSAVAKTVFEALSSVGLAVVDTLKKIPFGKILQGLLDGIVIAVKGAGTLLARIPWMDLLSGLANAFVLLGKKLGQLGVWILDAIGDAFKSAGDATSGWTTRLFDYLAGIDWGSITRKIFSGLAYGLLVGVEYLGRGIYTSVVWIIEKTYDLIVETFKALPSIVAGLGTLFKSAVRFMVNAVIGIFQGIENWLVDRFPKAAGVIHAVFSVIKGSLAVSAKIIGAVIDGVVVAFRVLWKIVGGIISLIAKGIDLFVITPLKFVASIISTVVVTAWKVLSAVVSAAWSVISPILSAFGKALSWVGEKLMWVVDKAKGAASAVGGFFKDHGSDLLGFVTGSSAAADAVDRSMQKIGKSTQQTASALSITIGNMVDSALTTVDSLIEANRKRQLAEASLAQGTLDTENAKYTAIMAMQQKFAADTAAVLKGVPESVQQAASQAQNELNRAFYEQLKSIAFNEQLSIEERKTALGGLEDWRKSKMEEFSSMVARQTREMVASNGAATKSIEDSFGKFSEGLQNKANETALRAGAAVGSVQKELGVSAEEALNNLKNIAAIDPKKFAADLKVIKQVYVDFAKTAQDQSQSMLVATGKAFDEFNKLAVEHWMKQRTNIALMAFDESDITKLTETIGRTVDRAFAALTAMIAAKVEDSVTKAFVSAFAKVLLQSKQFVKDSMTIFGDLASRMVKEFGGAWAKILDFATASITALEKDSGRAIANLRRIELAMRGTASAQVSAAGADVKQEVKLTVGKSELENIFQATHHPDWYEKDFKYRVMEILGALNSLAIALAATSKNTQTGAPASRNAASAIRNTAGVGIGSNRAVVRMNGAPS